MSFRITFGATFKYLSSTCLLLVALFSPTSNSFALCARDAMEANWVNDDGSTTSLARIKYTQACHDTVSCPDGHCAPTPGWIGTVHVFGTCSPTECDWGVARVYPHSNGWRYAVFEQGFAKKTVWLRLERTGKLRTSTFSDYTDPARSDRWDRDTFIRPL